MVRKLQHRRLALAGGVCALILAGSAAAQFFMPMGSLEAVAYPVAITPIPLDVSHDRSPEGANGPAAAPARPAAAQTRYRASPEVTRRVKRQFAAFVGRHGGDEEGFAAAMEREDFFARWGRHVSRYGLGRGDLADAMTAYWMINWQIANDVHEVSRDQVLASSGRSCPP